MNIAGPTSYTNQLNLVSRYGYDLAGRKTAETNANLEEIYYAYDPAGNLKSLTDGKNHVTRWNFDLYGRVTNKVDQVGDTILRYGYDANSRLTNRWSAGEHSVCVRSRRQPHQHQLSRQPGCAFAV